MRLEGTALRQAGRREIVRPRAPDFRHRCWEPFESERRGLPPSSGRTVFRSLPTEEAAEEAEEAMRLSARGLAQAFALALLLAATGPANEGFTGLWHERQSPYRSARPAGRRVRARKRLPGRDGPLTDVGRLSGLEQVLDEADGPSRVATVRVLPEPVVQHIIRHVHHFERRANELEKETVLAVALV